MRRIVLAVVVVAALGMPVAGAAQAALDPGDRRLEVVRPFTEHVLRSGPANAPELQSRYGLTEGAAELIEDYGGGRFTVGAFRAGPGDGVRVDLTRLSDGWIAGFIVEVDGQTQKIAVCSSRRTDGKSRSTLLYEDR